MIPTLVMDDWVLVRQMGIGEMQHVRAELLGIGFFSHDFLVQQLQEAMRAASKLNMMLRAHVNIACVDSPSGIFRLFSDNPNHQLEPWTNLSRENFEIIFKKLDVLIYSRTPYAKSDSNIERGINRLWQETNGRFLDGNFASRTAEELQIQYPMYFNNPDLFWERWNKCK